MIRVTDRTLSCLDNLPHDKSAVLQFLDFLIEMELSAIEISEKMYRLLSPLPEYRYILRIEQPAAAAEYPDVTEFVCRNAPIEADEKIRSEIKLYNTRKSSINTITHYADRAKVRIQGLDGIICGDYIRTFACLKEHLKGDIEFCPGNLLHCATALASEWIAISESIASTEGNSIVTSFGGIGGFAPTEEAVMILRQRQMFNAQKSYAFFPEMAYLFRKITKRYIRLNKPIIGKRIFNVESGIHVDGILKQPKCYEPFAPEIVGQTRKIVLGKKSGAASIRAKLSEFNIDCAQERIPLILEQVRSKAAEKNSAVADWEFVKIAMEKQA